MELLQEGLRRTGEVRTTFSVINPGSSEIQPNKLPVTEPESVVRLRELSQILFAESKEGKETGDQPQNLTPRTDGFEPFVNPEPTDNPLFINGYNGNFAQRMDINRRGIERVLKITHLDGQVVLTQFIPSRKSSSEAQGNELALKRKLFLGEKIEDDRENPLRRVVPTPEGWRIEINDTRITEELEEKKLTGKKLQTEFIQQFNRQLKLGVLKCVWEEKMSSQKDENFEIKAIASLIFPLVLLIRRALIIDFTYYVTTSVGITLLLSVVFNVANQLNSRGTRRNGRIIDHMWEYLMPPLEIDKVVRSAVFLGIKGRTLVKEIS